MKVELQLLGPVRVAIDGKQHTRFRTQKVLALLIYLAVHGRGEVVLREQLQTLLWPDILPKSAQANLRQTLYALRRLGKAEAESLVLSTRSGIQLNPAIDLVVDGDVLERARHGSVADKVAALKLYRAPFLEGFYIADANPFSEWVLARRAYYQHLYMELAEAAGNNLLAGGRHREAEALAHRQLEINDQHEPAYRLLMTALFLAGRRSEALFQYERCREILERELNVKPSRETQRLRDEIARDEEGAGHVQVPPAQDDQPLSAPESHHSEYVPNNLPARTIPFVGRQQEIAVVSQQLLDDSVKLMTILGPGGNGKSRLAIAVGESLLQSNAGQQRFADGIYFVSLVAVNDPDDLPSVIAAALDLKFVDSARSAFNQLADYLSDKSMLFILDNFEQLAHDSTFLSQIIEQAPQATFLTTSRVRLNLVAEKLFKISGLAERESAAGEENEAVALFLDRARFLRPGYEPDDEALKAIIAICRLVQGMPLAIILAAGWLDTLSPAEIAEEIRRDLDFLESEFGDLPDRQRSIRATFLHSWQMLSELEQQEFARLSVFRSGFTRPAAREVVRASPRILSRLIAKSFIHYDQHQQRYGVHELMRQFAHEMLAQFGDDERIGLAHVDYFLSSLADMKSDLMGWQPHLAAAKIALDYDNYLTAWRTGVRQKRWETVEVAVEALGRFYVVQERRIEGRKEFEAVIRQFRNVMPSGLFLRLLVQLCYLLWYGPHDTKTEYASEAIEIARSVGSLQLELEAEYFLVSAKWNDAPAECRPQLLTIYERALKAGYPFVAAMAAELAGATSFFAGVPQAEVMKLLDHSSELFTQERSVEGVMNIATKVGFVQVARGNGKYQEARTHYERGLRLFDDSGGVFLSNGTSLLRNLATINILEGRIASAELYIERCIEMERKLPPRGFAAAAVNIRGFAEANKVDFERAIASQHQALNILGSRFGNIIRKAKLSLARINLYQGNLSDAATYADESIRSSEVSGDRRLHADALSIRGQIHLAAKEVKMAQRLLTEAAAIQEDLERASRRMEPLAGLAKAAAQLGDRATASAYIDEIWDYLQLHTLDRTNEGFYPYFVQFELLNAWGDSRAPRALQMAHDHLMVRVQSLNSAAERESFWQNMPRHAVIAETMLRG